MKNNSYKKLITLFVVRDKKFESSLWGYKHIQATKKAVKIIESQIANVKFRVINKGLWSSPIKKELSLKIATTLRSLKKSNSLISILNQVNEKIFPNTPLITQARIKNEATTNMQTAFKKAQEDLDKKNFRALEMYLRKMTKSIVVKHFEEILPKKILKEKNQFFLCFTGSVMQLLDIGTQTAGMAFQKNRTSFLPTSSYQYPEIIIAHEICHLLGAKHNKLKQSLMNKYLVGGSTIDKTNLKRIQKKLRVI